MSEVEKNKIEMVSNKKMENVKPEIKEDKIEIINEKMENGMPEVEKNKIEIISNEKVENGITKAEDKKNGMEKILEKNSNKKLRRNVPELSNATFEIHEILTEGEPYFLIYYRGKSIVSPFLVKYNDICGWKHKDYEVKRVRKVKEYEDIYVLNGKCDLSMTEDIQSRDAKHKENTHSVITSFIRVSLCKLLCQFRNEVDGAMVEVIKGGGTEKMLHTLDKLFSLLKKVQKVSGRRSKWLESALDIYEKLLYNFDFESSIV